MNFINFSKFKLIFFVVAVIFIWQIFRFFPLLQLISKSDDNFKPKTSTELSQVMVTVFYEALCPDSKNFFIMHLLPTVTRAPHLVNVSLVPYGKAKTEITSGGTYSFSCQHGPVECNANKIHACAISQIPDSVLQIRYISCMISDNMIPELVGEKCAREMAVDWQSILTCSKSKMGNVFLRDHGRRTDALKPKISFVPTVLLNDKLLNQAAILKDFFREVCSLLKNSPAECPSSP